MNKEQSELKEQCPEFPHFGASYPDARCIDGYLWDLDKYEDGQLYGGGDDPCPFCNTDEHIEHHLDPLNGITKEVILAHIEYLKKRYS
jgi:hypothetical protein